MKYKNIALCILAAFLMNACDNIDEADRLIYVPPASVERAVLIEDFTGQRCVNCPNATLEIEKLQEEYGAENIIAVGIHSGPFAHRSTITSPFLPLGTETGDYYFNFWEVEAQPGTLINRTGGVIYNTQQYAAAVNAALAQKSPLRMNVYAELVSEVGNEHASFDINVECMTNENISDARLQVWITEDGIVSPQYMPDGSVKSDYVHNHVFRTSITQDVMGDPIQIQTESTATAKYRLEMQEAWNVEKINVVAFVYGNQGVIQAQTCRLMVVEETDPIPEQ